MILEGKRILIAGMSDRRSIGYAIAVEAQKEGAELLLTSFGRMMTITQMTAKKLNPVPDPSLTGELVNQSGQVVNVAHVIGTFYDNNGQIVWVADEYPSRALLPQTPVPFTIALPADVSSKVGSYRVVASTYSSSRFQ